MTIITQEVRPEMFFVYRDADLLGLVGYYTGDTYPSPWISSNAEVGIRHWNSFDYAVASLTRRFSADTLEECEAWLTFIGLTKHDRFGWISSDGRVMAGRWFEDGQFHAYAYDRRA